VIVIPHLRDNPDYAISIPLNTDHTIRKILEKQSADLHHELGLGNLSQFDFIVNKKIPHLLDINQNPDIKQGSVMRKGTEKMGVNMAEFWKHVIERARKEFKNKRQN
jgi:D-alanine-D-alanine ligase-like ATP-grasp enzyme